MSRFLVEIAYKGTRYCGWQIQPHSNTIQGTIESAISKILKSNVATVGCGRTDTGVHATQSFFHFDYEKTLNLKQFSYVLNKNLASDIQIKSVTPVDSSFHARFDAYQRSYVYILGAQKNPFLQNQYWKYPYGHLPSIDALNEAAQILLDYKAFYPFSKSNTDVKTYICDLTRSEWKASEGLYYYHVTSNRFLRGMIRLIVGMCVNYARFNVSESELRTALKNQTRLKLSYSAPPDGLYLNEVLYPEPTQKNNQNPVASGY